MQHKLARSALQSLGRAQAGARLVTATTLHCNARHYPAASLDDPPASSLRGISPGLVVWNDCAVHVHVTTCVLFRAVVSRSSSSCSYRGNLPGPPEPLPHYSRREAGLRTLAHSGNGHDNEGLRPYPVIAAQSALMELASKFARHCSKVKPVTTCSKAGGKQNKLVHLLTRRRP